jgi:hypothetical protein
MTPIMMMLGGTAAIIGAGEVVSTVIEPESAPVVVSSKKSKILKGLLIIFVVSVIALALAASISILVNQPKITNDIDMLQNTYNREIANLHILTDNLDRRVKYLENPQTTPPTLPLIPVSFQGGKDKFTSPEYMKELDLFRSFSQREQSEYLNLSKSDKLSKYRNMLH